MFIRNVRILLMDGPDLERGFLRTAAGKITAVGPMSEAPVPDAGERVIEGEGLSALPGFVDIHTHLGVKENSLRQEGNDVNEKTDPCTPHLRGIDAVFHEDFPFFEARTDGVSTVVTGPGSANPIGGQLAAIKTTGAPVDAMLLRAPVAMKMALGENPKKSYGGRGKQPATRMAAAGLIREWLYKTRRYIEDLEAGRQPAFDMKCEALIPVLKRELPVHIHCHRADDICTAIRLSKEFDLDTVLIHCTEGYKVTDQILEAGYPAVIGPIVFDRSKPELRDMRLFGAGRVDAAGVPMAICTDHPVIPIQYLPLTAGLAVRGGMDYRHALEAITLRAAKIARIDGRVGSLTPGKDADLVLCEGDPFEVYMQPKQVYISGEPVIR